MTSAMYDLVPGPMRQGPGRRSSIGGWRWSDRLMMLGAWAAGLFLCLTAAAIVIYFAVRGVEYLNPQLIFERPQVSASQSGSGGFLDPLLGTLLLPAIGLAIATPLAVATAVWLVEYGRPAKLARIVELCIEIVAGTPDIAIAVFGVAVFQLSFTGIFSSTSEAGVVVGRSFLAAGATLSLIAIPPLFVATRDGLQAVPSHMREAAFALGKTRIATIRRVVLPSVRSNIGTGATLGISRIIGDTAIVILLVGNTARIETVGGVPGVNVLRGLGSTLTTYIYGNSPAGEGGAPQKAYAAAFLLLLFILALNALVGRLSSAHARRSGLDALGAP